MRTELFQYKDGTKDLEILSGKAFQSSADPDVAEWFSFKEMKTATETQRGICVKAVSGEGNLLGFVYSQQESPINGKEGLEKWVIIIMAVDPNMTGQGVGTLLLKEIEKQAIDKGALKMFVYTNKGDDKVVSFYQKNGYSDAGWVKDYQYGSNNSAVFLLKYLS